MAESLTQAPAAEIAKRIEEPVPPLNYSEQLEEVDHGYLAASRGAKFYRSVFFQMILFGTLSFVGPSLSDAISNLGGGGLKDPDLANLAQALSSTCTCLVTLFGGPLINKIGIKYSCMITAFSFFLTGTGYYVNLTYKVQAYLVVARIVVGITNGFLYVAECTAMLSYPRPHERGLYISIWSAMRNSGGILGGAVSIATNYKTAGAGAVSGTTYLIFIAFESTGPLWAFLLTQTRNVRRKDGTRVPMSEDITWKNELRALYGHMKHKRTWLMALPSFYSFFFLGTFSTYLATHFSVRSRALSSFLAPTGAVITALLYGKFLDNKYMSRKSRTWWGMALWAVPQSAALIWIGIMWHRYPNKVALDYGVNASVWAKAYFPFLIMFCSGFYLQVYLYWVLASFSNDLKAASRIGGTFRAFETAGTATSFGLVSKAARAQKILWFNAAMFIPAVVLLGLLVTLMPEEPAEHDDYISPLHPDDAIKGKD